LVNESIRAAAGRFSIAIERHDRCEGLIEQRHITSDRGVRSGFSGPGSASGTPQCRIGRFQRQAVAAFRAASSAAFEVGLVCDFLDVFDVCDLVVLIDDEDRARMQVELFDQGAIRFANWAPR